MKTYAAAYIRVSTTEQVLHGYSIAAQRDTLKRYADSHHLEIVQWYVDEGISARIEIRKRPALQKMLNRQMQNIIANGEVLLNKYIE